ncbi:uncharacterized protein Z519_12795 [Cladophialophora bantiana CBS 173.52]|uniref:Uncharacterized protein n=1 Tax=Cladophialophora bantiana (strain ATCC 10958 / CBS 173.52 / CDC B-1940 / NIH 8579) TaxID=1442370 RepID=A0A0D2E922_CLAB1|nr:uncharacterized protein Z519_12795 [Cladophialophora bantiana CBS 173.52]KIW86611.1 hypothetical protein Z519_12795 [Cladophialophora bantiana CBS 173.52]
MARDRDKSTPAHLSYASGQYGVAHVILDPTQRKMHLPHGPAEHYQTDLINAKGKAGRPFCIWPPKRNRRDDVKWLLGLKASRTFYPTKN